MKYRNINFRIPQPEIHLPGLRFSRWLPTRGNALFTLLMIALLLWAQTAGALPLFNSQSAANTSQSTIAYQGRLADADGAPLTAVVSMIFRVYSQEVGGAPLWEEQWTGSNGVRVSDGLFNVMLGSLTPIPAALITSHSSLFLGITVGTDDEMAPRVQLGTVPFAVQALTVPDDSVSSAKIANGAVGAADLAAGAVGADQLADASVSTVKIQDGSVTASKLAPGVLTGVPRGTIVMWSGTLATIPAGWVLCDGANGTPDLRDRFILSVGTGENPGATGGANTKALDISNLPSHSHAFTTSNDGNHSHSTHFEDEGGFGTGSKSGADDTSGNGISTTSNGSHSHSGTTNAVGGGAAFDVRPAFYELAFIMKQ